MHSRSGGVLKRLLSGTLCAVLLLASAVLAAETERRVDNPVDAWSIAASGPAGKAVDAAFARRPDLLDTTDAKRGDFSIVFTVSDPTKNATGFSAGRFVESWQVDGGYAVHLWAKAVAPESPKKWELALYDDVGTRAFADLPGMAADGTWREFTVPLAALKADGGFRHAAVRSVQVEAQLPKAARLWLDDVCFQKGDVALGVSDKTVTQYMAEAEATRQKRVEAMLSAGKPSQKPQTPGHGEMSALWQGRDLDQVNGQVIEWCKAEKSAENVAGNWSLSMNTTLNWLYFGFSSKGRLKPGRLTPECEKELLDLYWKHCELKNDIAIARHGPWWVTGSENHDCNFKVANLLSSQMFMHEPQYASRVYPDLGKMHGYGYAGGFLMQKGRVPPFGRGQYKDGKEYKAEDHYRAWVAFWKDYLAERARHGFFIEHNASSYMKWTNSFLHDIYAWSDDEDLRRQCRMFMDLVWAQWAQDQLLTCSGGAGTRMKKGYGYFAMSDLAVFLLGGPAQGGEYSFQVLSDYQWPRAVWELILDRRGKGEYAFLSRKPNEEQNVTPRPAGAEYTMLVRPDSRLARSSWVTPDYVLGVRMDHPTANYCHLSRSRSGMIFATDPDAYLTWEGWDRAVQSRGVVIFQQKKNWLSTSPEWVMGWTAMPGNTTVNFGGGIRNVSEKGGWVFIEEGNAFAAVCMVTAGQPPPNAELPLDAEGFELLVPKPNASTLDADAKSGAIRGIVSAEHFPVVIVEASRRERHPSLEAFQKDVLDNPLVLRKTIGSFLLSYKGCGPEATQIEFNAGNETAPTVNGRPVDYECPTFDSPHLQGAAGSGIVTIHAPISGKRLVLDFNKIERREE